jgi:two-component system NtrC family response regulator
MSSGRVLVVDDDDSLRRVLQVQLEDLGYEVATAAGSDQALASLTLSPCELVLTDLKMPGMSGIELLRRIRTVHPETIVIVITAFGSIETAVEAMRAGAYDYVTKPVVPDALELTVSRALQHLRLVEEVRALRSTLDRKFGFESIMGRSEALLQVLDQAARAAQTDATVLIHGETGTGKELLAKAIHFNSTRKERAFVTINCGAIPRELLESELFGHVKGSFTGATSDKKGKLEVADRGTVFLDEIGELPLELQVKLLRLVQQGELAKVGATTSVTVDVRLIAATHRNLKTMIEDGAFREDLYYRLSVIPLEVPPLRDRADDIAELTLHFLAKLRVKHGRPQLNLPNELLPYFTRYRWPGNIRELENVIERMVVLAQSNDIAHTDLPEPLRRDTPRLDFLPIDLPNSGISIEAVEKELILRALRKFDWNQTHAARYLDLSRKTLIYRMEKFGLRKDHYEDALRSQER